MKKKKNKTTVSIKKIENRIEELKKEIDECAHYDLTHPRYQNRIKLRRNTIWELLKLLGREKEYDVKDYFGIYF